MNSKLLLILENPINGYWDGGSKKQFTFEIWREPKEDNKGKYVRVECYDANNWFHVALGKTENQTWGNVKRRFSKKLKGISHKWELIRGVYEKIIIR